MTRVAGHGLRNEGAPYDDRGYLLAARMIVSTGGEGRAKCECGALSPVMQSGAERKRWHREVHKVEVTSR